MNGEWFFTIAVTLLPALVSALFGYFLGTRSQKKQDLREYITETVKEKYPQLFAEIKRNSDLLDNYLNDPFIHFSFPLLEQLYNEGRDEFMTKHHKDLHLIVDFFYTQICPKLNDFHNLNKGSRKKIFLIWKDQLVKSGLRLAECEHIAKDLVTARARAHVKS